MREIERERQDVFTVNIYNTIQKSVVGVKDAALWKGPHMTALKLAAVESINIIKKNTKRG
jgi:hypothetical protein